MVVNELGVPITLADAVWEGLSDLSDAVMCFRDLALSKLTTTGGATGTWMSFPSPIFGVVIGENMEIAPNEGWLLFRGESGPLSLSPLLDLVL